MIFYLVLSMSSFVRFWISPTNSLVGVTCRLHSFQACDRRYCMEFVHEIPDLVRSQCLDDNLYYGSEVQTAIIYAIVGDIPHMPP